MPADVGSTITELGAFSGGVFLILADLWIHAERQVRYVVGFLELSFNLSTSSESRLRRLAKASPQDCRLTAESRK